MICENSLIKNKKDFENILERLKKNPLFYLFGENKENFHSSFWYWMFTVDKAETIKVLTGHIFGENEADKFEFYREQSIASKLDNKIKARCDVILESGDKRLIIETKVKSFPTIPQLKRIEKAATNAVNKSKSKYQNEFMCIHLYPATVVSEVKGSLVDQKWRFLDFSELSKRIDIQKFSEKNKEYNLYIITVR